MMIDTIDETMAKLRAINDAYYNEREMVKLDQQGRHRSQWIYSKYDGRKVSPPKNGGTDGQDNHTNRTE